MKYSEKIFVYLRMVNLRRIKNMWGIYRREGLSGIRYHFALVKDKERGKAEKRSKEYRILPVVERTGIGQYDVIEFEECENPKVSILIPVYDQFAYTYNCLKSIKIAGDGVDYEIIVGDDNSSDCTSELESVVKGIRVVHNRKNLQFLHNCNEISKKARGKYILFLNNDTQVQENWLKELIDLMEEYGAVGLAGSKLIYPNGLVQEAGGIVWRDATVLQYGNGRQSGEEELNFLREADYISGASVIVRKFLWEEIGGFDTRFAPAYYEDVDLAFQVKSLGYKIVYQPRSEVIHFEGVTENSRDKKDKMIEDNRRKFLAKWEEKLNKDHVMPERYTELVAKMKISK